MHPVGLTRHFMLRTHGHTNIRLAWYLFGLRRLAPMHIHDKYGSLGESFVICFTVVTFQYKEPMVVQLRCGLVYETLWWYLPREVALWPFTLSINLNCAWSEENTIVIQFVILYGRNKGKGHPTTCLCTYTEEAEVQLRPIRTPALERVCWRTTHSGRFTLQQRPGTHCFTVQGVWWASAPVWTGWKNLSPPHHRPGFDPRTVHPVEWSLNRLSYSDCRMGVALNGFCTRELGL